MCELDLPLLPNPTADYKERKQNQPIPEFIRKNQSIDDTVTREAGFEYN